MGCLCAFDHGQCRLCDYGQGSSFGLRQAQSISRIWCRSSLPLLKIWLPESMLHGVSPPSSMVPFSGVLYREPRISLTLHLGKPQGAVLGLFLFIGKHCPGDLRQAPGNCYSVQTGFPASTLVSLRWHSSQGIPVKIGVRSCHSLAQTPSKTLLYLKGKAEVIRVAQKALCHEHLQLLGLQHFAISLWPDRLLLFPLPTHSNHLNQSRFCPRAFALADFPGDADVTLSLEASLSKLHIMHSPSTS